MAQVTIVVLDLVKRVLQVHGATADGGIAIRKKLSRGQGRPKKLRVKAASLRETALPSWGLNS